MNNNPPEKIKESITPMSPDQTIATIGGGIFGMIMLPIILTLIGGCVHSCSKKVYQSFKSEEPMQINERSLELGGNSLERRADDFFPVLSNSITVGERTFFYSGGGCTIDLEYDPSKNQYIPKRFNGQPVEERTN